MYQFPSLSRAASKLPCIDIAGIGLAERYQLWFREAEGIPRCVPPLYQDFVIRYSLRFGGGDHSYVDIVHYSDDLTQFEVCHTMDGKKILTAESDYADYYDLMVHAKVHAPSTTQYQLDWLKNEGLAAVFCVLATQAFILYHRPDVVPVEIPQPQGKSKSKTGSVAAPAKSHIKDSVRQYIRLTESDQAPAQRNYRAIQWQVRGHYRHLERADGTKYAVYVKPHLAKRGNKQNVPNAPKTIEIDAVPNKEVFYGNDD